MALPKTYVEGFHDLSAVKKMEYSQLGGTDMLVSKLGIGGGAYSGFYDEFDDNEAGNILEYGLKQGMNYIDTAPLYGAGRSEIVIGKALKAKGIPRQSFYISSKVGRYGTDWATIDYSKERVQRSVNESLNRLGLTYLDIIFVHDVEFADRKQVLEETLPAVEEMVKQGKVRYIGVSAYPLSPIWEVIEKSKVRIDVIIAYARDTLIDTTLNDYMPRLNGKGIGVITASPTACQLLTNIGPRSWHPADERIRQTCKDVAEYCKKNHVEFGNLAVSYALESKNTKICLVGMMTMEIMKDNLKIYYNGRSPVEQKILDYIKAKMLTQKEHLHWEGVEIALYKKHMESIGRPLAYL